MLSCANTGTYTLQRLKKWSANKKTSRNEGGRMLFPQFEFGRNTQTALFFRNKSPKVTFLFQAVSIPGILLQKAVSP